MHRTTLLKVSRNPGKPVLAGTLALCSALALIFSSAVTAEESVAASVNSKDLSREQLQTVVDSAGFDSSAILSRNNSSVIAQIGDDNRATVDQARNTAAFAFGNYASIVQSGNNNEANIIQSGGNNIGLIGQLGRDHEATIEQDGNRFEARINQFGIKSNIDVSQSGSGLRSISVRQNSVSGMTAPVTIRTN